MYNLYQLKGLEALDTINKRPLIGVSGCRELGSMHPFHRCSEKYLLAVINPIGGTPVILPALPELEEFAEYIDGLLLTGSPSKLFEPFHQVWQGRFHLGLNT